MNQPLENIHIQQFDGIMTPAELHAQVPLSPKGASNIEKHRQRVADIIERKDHRLIVVVGPCSIHDEALAKDYANRLAALREKVKDELEIVMRVYFEKPRTTVGWKGYINDPDLTDEFAIEKGMVRGRELLTWLADLDLPTATEALNPISPQYFGDLFAWTAIGARTSESQTHREMSSGLSTPVGFKNGTDGNLDIAINAWQSAANPHRFLGIDDHGKVSIVTTKGNPHGHIILRGGKEPNYDSVNVALAEQAIEKAGLAPTLIVDCSHANSHKNHELQPLVAKDVAKQIQSGNQSIVGIMLESNIKAGNQKLGNPSDLEYGVSITDACIDWETTEKLLLELAEMVCPALNQRA